MAPEQPGAPTPTTVLVIDDEDYVADMIASALESEGLTTYVAYNGRDGLTQAQTVTADLLVVDIMMPYLSGTELVAQLRELPHMAATPVLLISAGARPRQQLPHVTFLSKPFDMLVMTDLVLQLIGGER